MKNEVVSVFLELYPLVAALVAMGVTQVVKAIYFYFVDEKLNFKHLFTAGGMPSSHSAMVSALSVAIGLQEGWTSSLFCMCIVFSLVVLYDATGVRQAVGRQAVLVNQIVDDMFAGDFKTEKLTELLGHTPLEVVVGVFLGVGIAFTLYY
jgi:acid phosphatase family membrane protein YuiD